jgi:(R,R)-butanediol dehydrogenase / meso-butanediol dehydrogenase / diacetyl reductase
MRTGIYDGPKMVKTSELPKPSINKNEALIRVTYAGICGTDMMIYSGKHPRAKAPLIMGHEFAGVIEEINEDSELKENDRVVIEPLLTCGHCAACRAGQSHVCINLKYIGIDKDGGFAEYVAVPIDHLRKLPDSVSNKEAALIEPLSVAIHTVRRSPIKVGDVVTILGAGPIGLLIGLIAKEAGAEKIFISDVSTYRLSVAASLGFTTINAKEENIVERVKDYTHQVGADVVFEVAGNQITADQMIQCIKFQGTLMVVSVYKSPPTIDLASMHFQEISLTTTRCYEQEDFTKAIKILEHKKIDVNPLISHVLSLKDITIGFELMENTEASLKILFNPTLGDVNNE